MAKTKTTSSSSRMRPALSPEARENQIISMAYDLAEQQIRDGTASSQVISHFLKLGSTRERLEHELKMKELELMEAKTESLRSAERSEKLMKEAIEAFRSYSGNGDSYED